MSLNALQSRIICVCTAVWCAPLVGGETTSAYPSTGEDSDHFRVIAADEPAHSSAMATSFRLHSSSPMPSSQRELEIRQVASQREAELSTPVVPPAPSAADGSLPIEPPSPTEPAPVSDAYTIEALESMALANNPTLHQASASVGKARGFRRQLGLYPNPTIGYQGNEIGDEGQPGQQGAFLSQTIVTGDKLDLGQNVADWEVESTQWEAEAQRLRVLNGVRTQFYQTLGAQRRVEVARRLVAVAETGVRAATALKSSGQVGRPDVLQARIQLNEVRIILRNAEAAAKAAWRQLATLVGRSDLAPAPLAGNLKSETHDWDFDALFAELCAASPQLQAARARVSRARAQIRFQEAQPIPNINLQVGGAHDYGTGDAIANVQVGLPIPIFNRNQGNIEIAHSELHRAIADLHRLELKLQNRAAAVLREYRQAASQVELYSGEILPAAEENLELTEAAYEQGEFDLLRALTARRSYFEANLALITSHVNLQQADILLSGLLLSDGLTAPPDSGIGNQVGTGLRGQALSGQ